MYVTRNGRPVASVTPPSMGPVEEAKMLTKAAANLLDRLLCCSSSINVDDVSTEYPKPKPQNLDLLFEEENSILASSSFRSGSAADDATRDSDFFSRSTGDRTVTYVRPQLSTIRSSLSQGGVIFLDGSSSPPAWKQRLAPPSPILHQEVALQRNETATTASVSTSGSSCLSDQYGLQADATFDSDDESEPDNIILSMDDKDRVIHRQTEPQNVMPSLYTLRNAHIRVREIREKEIRKMQKEILPDLAILRKQQKEYMC